jgi:hypothetical protein
VKFEISHYSFSCSCQLQLYLQLPIVVAVVVAVAVAVGVWDVYCGCIRRCGHVRVRDRGHERPGLNPGPSSDSNSNVLSPSLSLSLTHTHTHIKSSRSPLEEKFNGKHLLAFISFSLGFSSLFLCVFNQVFYMPPFAGKINVSPRLQNMGTRVQGDAQGGHVEAPPNDKSKY